MPQTIYEKERMRVPVVAWLDQMDEGVRDQLVNLARLPVVHHHAVAMPDAHVGIGATIGSVFGAVEALVPSAVGVDIGCGMCAVPTGAPANTMKGSGALDAAQMKIFRTIPLGMEGWKHPQPWKTKNTVGGFKYESDAPNLTREIQEFAPFKLGSLGGGNHFIEFQKDEQGMLWIMIHSGSRHAGNAIATHYMKAAQGLAAKIDPSTPRDLAYLPTSSALGQGYLRDMTWALNYAYENRRLMMRLIMDIVQESAARAGIETFLSEDAVINIHHNYAAEEDHYGRKVWVHRKGATLASRDTIGIIPGSMGNKSFIVRGLGNKESLQSCSHGAGRQMSRTQAKAQISESAMRHALGDVRVLHKSDVRDEAPQAYKPIEDVMRNQSDLVEVLHELTPMATIKG